jgi:D-alanyl-lipoteichoic acid acyltransferase DltB (MBOAT superfamily)
VIYLFHSVEFVAFAALVCAAYWALPQRRRNALLLAASLAFYASWDWRFLVLLVGSAAVDHFCARRLAATEDVRRRRFWLGVSLASNLGALGFFKWGELLSRAVELALSAARIDSPSVLWQFALPLGISFYTFQKMGYMIDVHRKTIRPEERFSDFLLFVSYFPQLIAGPIERARDLIPRLQAPKSWARVEWREGLYLYVWGFFKKTVVADSVGRLVPLAFAPGAAPAGADVLLSLYAFALQLYCDFSGYSDMARGISHFFGVRISVNFDTPFFARSYFDFYRRWHITLCDWIAEYVYAPLLFWLPSRGPLRRLGSSASRLFWSAVLALLATRMVFALWHGAQGTFFALGLYIFAVQMVTVLLRPLGRAWIGPASGPGRWALGAGRTVIMFHLFCLAMLLFRSADLGQAASLAGSLLAGVDPAALFRPEYWYFYVSFAFVGAYEYLQFRRGDQLFLCRSGFAVQLAFYLALAVLYVHVGAMADQRFLYFQF